MSAPRAPASLTAVLGRFCPLLKVALAAACVLVAGCSAHPHEEAPLVTHTNRISGKVVEVEPLSERLILADAGRHVAVTWASGTVVKSGSREIAISDLRQGDLVVVSLRRIGESEARIITLAGPEREPAPSPTPGEKPEESR